MNIFIFKKNTSFIITLVMVFFLSFGMSCDSSKQDSFNKQNNVYYINSVTGNDSANGTTENTAWKSFKNIENRVLNPGDQILLSGTSVFTEALFLKDIYGTKEDPVRIATYNADESQTNKKAIISVKGKPEAILIQDCSFLVLKNLQVSANAKKVQDASLQSKMRCGIKIITVKDPLMQDILLEGLQIENTFYENPGFVRSGKEVKTSNGTQKYGWGIRVINHDKTAVIKNITIKKCRVENVSHTGIKFTGNDKNIQNIIVEDCKIFETGGPGIQMSGVKGGHIFNNHINRSGNKNDSRKWGRGSGLWTWGSSNILIEKNHFLNAGGPGDSAGCHIDFNCKNVVVQYNFSANNAGGFCEILGNNYNCSYRYNISVNDGYRVKGINGAFQEGKTLWLSGYVGRNKERNGPFNTYIYNNTIFVSDSIISKYAFDKAASGILVMNNIFYIEGKSKGVPGDQYNPDTKGGFNIKNIIFKNNLFLNSKNWPSEIPIKDKSPLFGNPEFENKGGMTLANYNPKNIELIVDKGQKINLIPNDQVGLTIGLRVTHDILGNPISNAPDLGAIEIAVGNN